MTGTTTLGFLNHATEAEFVAALDGVFEHAPWVPARAALARPFPSAQALHEALMTAARLAPEEEQLRFLNGHPELTAGPLAAGLTDASRLEQGGSPLALVPGAEELASLQRLYRERFGIPFIICLRRHTPADVIRSLRRRLGSGLQAERDAAFDEVGHVSRLRLRERLGLDGAAGTLSVQVRDGATGEPAASIGVLLRAEDHPVGTWVTGPDGGTDSPLLSGGALRIGSYELRITASPYSAEPNILPWLEAVSLRFRIADPEAHCDLPVTLAPQGCSVGTVA